MTAACWLLAGRWAAFALDRLVGSDGGIWPHLEGSDHRALAASLTLPR
jgi:hypothetical protein